MWVREIAIIVGQIFEPLPTPATTNPIPLSFEQTQRVPQDTQTLVCVICVGHELCEVHKNYNANKISKQYGLRLQVEKG